MTLRLLAPILMNLAAGSLCDLEKAVTNPVEYWKINKHLWPRLARMGQWPLILGVPVMSSEAERTFSDTSQIFTKRQNRLWTETIGACQCQG
jgi:hAT family C-terminal dimerisation region